MFLVSPNIKCLVELNEIRCNVTLVIISLSSSTFIFTVRNVHITVNVTP